MLTTTVLKVKATGPLLCLTTYLASKMVSFEENGQDGKSHHETTEGTSTNLIEGASQSDDSLNTLNSTSAGSSQDLN